MLLVNPEEGSNDGEYGKANLPLWGRDDLPDAQQEESHLGVSELWKAITKTERR